MCQALPTWIQTKSFPTASPITRQCGRSPNIETEDPLTAAEIHRDLSLHMHGSYADNLTGQKQLASRFRLAGALLTIEVFLWIIDLASKI